MVSEFTNIQVIEIGKFISIQTAREVTGYNHQYLRRLLRSGKLDGFKLGQIWLIDYSGLQDYFKSKSSSSDKRCGPKGSPEDQCKQT